MLYRVLLGLGCLLLWACAPQVVKVVDLPQANKASVPLDVNAPQLRLNTEMHTAMINRSAIDKQQRYLVTASDDKTARVWSLDTGELLQVLRVPIGTNHEGKLYAVAISPDGKTVAVAGWTSCELNKTSNYCIYLFQRQTGKLIKRLEGLPNVINHLTYSPDGSYLVVLLHGKNGIRIYNSGNYKLVFTDRNYDNQAIWAEFSYDGKLVTSSLDSYIRLYNKDFKLQAKKRSIGGNHPSKVTFSLQGDKIAVGFNDTTRINILSTKDLSLLYSPDTLKFRNGNLNAVAWSSDGKRLFAAGAYARYGNAPAYTEHNPVIVWKAQGRGKNEIWNVKANNLITNIQTLNDGSLLVLGSDPMWTRINSEGKLAYSLSGKALLNKGSIADFRGFSEKNFALSKDAARIVFKFSSEEKSSMVFDLKQSKLSFISSFTEFILPRTDSSFFNITGWYNRDTPKFNGKTIRLMPQEYSRRLAITSDEHHFLLGTSWWLRYFNNKGNLIWKQAVLSEVWGVNISANNQIAIAALGDGTLRWYRLHDGEELLALFVHPKDKRWVLWTPQGYYTASVGGESLVGWHVNRGVDQNPDFYEIGQFRSRFYRPDVIAEVLPQMSVDNAVTVANAKLQQPNKHYQTAEILPPSIHITPLNTNNHFSSEQLTLTYQIHNPSKAKLGKIKVLMNGRVMPEHYILKQQQGQLQLHNLPKNSFDLGLVVANEQGIISKTATLKLQYATVTSRGTEIAPKLKKKGKLYVLAIGNSDYQDKNVSPLKYADDDAQDFAAFMKTQKGNHLYTDVEVNSLIDQDKNSIIEGLVWLEKRVKQHDTAIIFLAGHGFSEKNKYYFLPKDGDSNKLRTSAVPYYELRETLTNLKGKVILFLDSCRSGELVTKGLGMLDTTYITNDLGSEQNGVMVITASNANEPSYESDSLEHGFFTQTLLDIFQAKAKYIEPNQAIRVLRIAGSITDHIEGLLKGTNRTQTPKFSIPDSIDDFKILVTGEKESAK